MNSIRILPPGLQNQIAAGEVVERPSSVVKELMENSLDAGSNSIHVYLKNGGQSLIEIIDNGSGLEADQLPLAMTRHATSKISAIEELTRINSFGFRGEALPSIASISHLTIASRPPGKEEGFYLELLYGEVTDQGFVAMKPGTRVRVENLLSNVPARLKFLKTRPTENKKCLESFIRHCLANLNCGFELFSESRSVYRFFPDQDLLQRLESIWPSHICENLHSFSLQHSDMSIHGLASSPHNAQARGDRLMFYVNKRPVSDRMLLSAVRQAYKGKILSREYPQAVIFINLPPQMVDVNVHPAKNEVRFRNEQEVFSLVTRGLRSCLEHDIYQSPGTNNVQSKYPDPDTDIYTHIEKASSDESQEQEKLFRRFREKQAAFQAVKDNGSSNEENLNNQNRGHDIAIKGLSYLGQAEKSYLLFLRNKTTLVIVDQHAAHERIMLQRIRNSLKHVVIKRLVTPERMVLHPSELELIQDIWKELRAMGFILEISSDSSLMVTGIPDFMSPREAMDSLKDILSMKKIDLDEILNAMACRTAIKAGSSLTPHEALGLVQNLLACDDNQFCPHGRPISREIGNTELKKMFKR